MEESVAPTLCTLTYVCVSMHIHMVISPIQVTQNKFSGQAYMKHIILLNIKEQPKHDKSGLKLI